MRRDEARRESCRRETLVPSHLRLCSGNARPVNAAARTRTSRAISLAQSNTSADEYSRSYRSTERVGKGRGMTGGGSSCTN